MPTEKSKILEPAGLLLVALLPEKSNKPPILFIHGRHGSAFDWQQYMHYFSSAGWPSYAVSLRGHYGTRFQGDISKIRFSDFVEDVKTAVKEIGQVPVLIGFSMGGRVCQKYVEMYPAKALVLLNSTEPKALLKKIPSHSVLQKIPSVVYPRIDGLKRSIGEALPKDRLMQIYSTMTPESGMVLREMFMGIEVNPSKICVPVFVVDSDSRDKCKKLAEFYNADSLFFEDIGHGGVIWGRRWQEVAEAINRWLNEKVTT